MLIRGQVWSKCGQKESPRWSCHSTEGILCLALGALCRTHDAWLPIVPGLEEKR